MTNKVRSSSPPPAELHQNVLHELPTKDDALERTYCLSELEMEPILTKVSAVMPVCIVHISVVQISLKIL